jgi:NAD-dependent dihydropyrimidine dehydrogenase PreA subunit
VLSIIHRPGKSIADVCWSERNDNELLVSYQRFAHIDIFDLLSTHTNSTSVLTVPRLVCEIGADVTDGHLCMLFVKSSKHLIRKQANANTQTPSYDKVIAGSTNGMLRCWELAHNNPNRCKRVAWEVCVDTHTAHTQQAPIVGLAFVSAHTHDDDQDRKRMFVALSARGVVYVYDCARSVRVGVGGGTGRVFTVPEQVRAIHIPTLTHAVGLSVPPNTHANTTINGQHAVEDVCVHITAASGDIYVVNIWNRVVFQWKSPSNTGLLTAKVHTLCRHIDIDFVVNDPSLCVVVCGVCVYVCMQAADPSGLMTAGDLASRRTCTIIPAVCLPGPYDKVCVVAGQSATGHGVVRIVSMQAPPHTQRYEHNILTGTVTQTQAHTWINGLRKNNTNTMTLTLPGHVVTATPGDTEVLVSEDLRNYLVASYLSVSSQSRSDQIYFDWSRIDTNTYTNTCLGSGIRGSYNVVDNFVGKYTVVLKETYAGPAVCAGYPRVSMRTNLVLSGGDEDSVHTAKTLSLIDSTADKRAALTATSSSSDTEDSDSESGVKRKLIDPIIPANMNDAVNNSNNRPIVANMKFGRLNNNRSVTNWQSNSILRDKANIASSNNSNSSLSKLDKDRCQYQQHVFPHSFTVVPLNPNGGADRKPNRHHHHRSVVVAPGECELFVSAVANHPHPTTNSACGGGLTCLVGLENGRVLLLALPSSATVAAVKRMEKMIGIVVVGVISEG